MNSTNTNLGVRKTIVLPQKGNATTKDNPLSKSTHIEKKPEKPVEKKPEKKEEKKPEKKVEKRHSQPTTVAKPTTTPVKPAPTKTPATTTPSKPGAKDDKKNDPKKNDPKDKDAKANSGKKTEKLPEETKVEDTNEGIIYLVNQKAKANIQNGQSILNGVEEKSEPVDNQQQDKLNQKIDFDNAEPKKDVVGEKNEEKPEEIPIEQDKSEMENKHEYKRPSLISVIQIPQFSSNYIQALYLIGCCNLLPNKLRYHLLTLNPEIYERSGHELSKIIKDKKNIVDGKIKMFQEIKQKYSSPVYIINKILGIRSCC